MTIATRRLSDSPYAGTGSNPSDMSVDFGPMPPLPAKVQAAAARAVRRLARDEGDAVELLDALGLGASC